MKIIILGNGFDLAHGIDTSYGQFLRWYKEDNALVRTLKYLENQKGWIDCENDIDDILQGFYELKEIFFEKSIIPLFNGSMRDDKIVNSGQIRKFLLLFHNLIALETKENIPIIDMVNNNYTYYGDDFSDFIILLDKWSLVKEYVGVRVLNFEKLEKFLELYIIEIKNNLSLFLSEKDSCTKEKKIT